MTDQELLEKAAKAAGIDGQWEQRLTGAGIAIRGQSTRVWNPLRDDGDALRLAALLRIDCEFTKTAAGARDFAYVEPYEDHGFTRAAAVRRAIVRAAAEIAG